MVLDSINPYVIAYSGNEADYTFDRKYQHELAWLDDNNRTYGIGQRSKDYTIRFQRRFHFDNFIRSVADAGHKQLLRDDTKGLDITITYPLHYKQTYDGKGGLGAYIPDDEVYVAANVFNVNENQGLWGLSNKLSLPNSFKNSMWDYYTELFEQNLSKAIIEPGIFGSVPVYGSIGAEVDITLDVKRLKSFKLAGLLNEVGKITASHYEFSSGSKYYDLTKYENVKIQGRNTGEITVPMVYHNMPTALDNYIFGYNDRLDANGLYSVNAFNYQFGDKIKIRNLFYMDSPAILQDGVEAQAFKVHDWVDYYIANGVKLSSRAGFGFTAYDLFRYFSAPQFKPAEVAMSLQANGWSTRVTKALDRIFGVTNLVRINIEIDFNEYTWFEGGGEVGFPHARMDACYILDLDEFYPNINLPSDKWYMISSELDMETETAKIELLSRGLP